MYMSDKITEPTIESLYDTPLSELAVSELADKLRRSRAILAYLQEHLVDNAKYAVTISAFSLYLDLSEGGYKELADSIMHEKDVPVMWLKDLLSLYNYRKDRNDGS